MPAIAPTAVVAPGARLGEGVTIGHGTVVYEDVELGDGTTVGELCVIGAPVAGAPPLRVGAGSTIRSHAVVEQGSTFGPGFETGHHVLVRAGATVGTNLRLGSYGSLEGELVIGDWVRAQTGCIFGEGSVVEDLARFFPGVKLLNDPLPPSHAFAPVHVGSGAVVCADALLLPGCRLGTGAFVAAGARVAGDVPAATVVAADGRPAGPVTHLMSLEHGVRHPWTRHFADGYPPDAQDRIAVLHEAIVAAARTAPRTAAA